MKRLGGFAHAKVEAAAHEAANTALPRMKERFAEVRLIVSHALARLGLALLWLLTRCLLSCTVLSMCLLWTRAGSAPCFCAACPRIAHRALWVLGRCFQRTRQA